MFDDVKTRGKTDASVALGATLADLAAAVAFAQFDDCIHASSLLGYCHAGFHLSP